MSVIETIQKLFKTKPAPPQDSMDDVSLDMSVDPLAAGSMNSMASTAASAQAEGSAGPESQNADEASRQVELLSLPILGRRPMGSHQRILVLLLGVAVAVLASVTFVALNQADQVAQQVAATGQSLMQSQRLAKSVSQALVGSAQAFPDVKESSDVLAKTVRGLKAGEVSLRLEPVAIELQTNVDVVTPLMERAEKNSATVMGQQAILTQVGNALRTINRQSSDLLEIAETVSSLKLQQNAAPAEISAAGQLVMLTQRIGKSANEFLTMEGVSPEAVFLLGKDLNSFKEIAQGLQEGSPELRLSGPKIRRPASGWKR